MILRKHFFSEVIHQSKNPLFSLIIIINLIIIRFILLFKQLNLEFIPLN